MTDTISVTGDTMLAATLHNAARQLDDMAATNRQAGEVVRARAASNAPKRTGRLAGSVRVSASGHEAVVSSSVVYAARVNYGMPSVGQVAQPFMTNALASTASASVDKYEARVNAIVRTIRGA